MFKIKRTTYGIMLLTPVFSVIPYRMLMTDVTEYHIFWRGNVIARVKGKKWTT